MTHDAGTYHRGTLAAISILCGLLELAPALLGAQTTTFDPGTDFSVASNPAGVWQYGYSATNSLAPNQFHLDRYAQHQGGVVFWQPDSVESAQQPAHYPYVAFNTDKSHTDNSIGWAIRAGEVAMEASNTGQYSLLRFVAPKGGTYRVTARFEGIHFGLSTTDVHILHDTTSLFAADIEGYGGDSTSHTIEGAHPAASYSGEVQLKAGDTITFAIGYGKNKSHVCDTTGLIASITLATAKGH